MYTPYARSSRGPTDNLVWTSFTVGGTLPVSNSELCYLSSLRVDSRLELYIEAKDYYPLLLEGFVHA